MARRELHRLSARAVATLTAYGRHADGGNLYLMIAKDGSRRWTFLYREQGRLREMGLGPAAGPRKAGLSLHDARRKADEARRLRFNGIDPLSDKRAQRTSAGTKTFGGFADELIESIAPGFKSAIHLNQWKSTLKDHAAPLRPMLIHEVGTEHILQVLQPIWQTKQETASRLRGRIERVLDAARAKGLRTGDNPARWRGHLKELLAKPSKLARGHHAAIHYDDMPAFMADLRQRKSVSAHALEFTILTAARTGETIGARWSEIDLDRALWIIPRERMKAAAEHHVPLSSRTIEILRAMGVAGMAPEAFVFPGGKRNHPLSAMAMLECLRDLRGKGTTVHGFRSSFRDWAGDKTAFPRDLAESALAHVIGNKAEAAYRRSDALEKRRKLMAAWQNFLAAPRGGNVLKLRAKSAS